MDKKNVEWCAHWSVISKKDLAKNLAKNLVKNFAKKQKIFNMKN